MTRHGLFTNKQLARPYRLLLSEVDLQAKLGLLHPICLRDGVFYTSSDVLRIEIIQKGKRSRLALAEIKLLIKDVTTRNQQLPFGVGIVTGHGADQFKQDAALQRVSHAIERFQKVVRVAASTRLSPPLPGFSGWSVTQGKLRLSTALNNNVRYKERLRARFFDQNSDISADYHLVKDLKSIPGSRRSKIVQLWAAVIHSGQHAR